MEVQGENLESGAFQGCCCSSVSVLSKAFFATSSPALSQRELPLCKLAGRAGGVGERVGQEACLVSSQRGDLGGGRG